MNHHFAFRQCSYLTLAALIISSVILRSLFCAAVGGISLIRFSGVEKSPWPKNFFPDELYISCLLAIFTFQVLAIRPSDASLSKNKASWRVVPRGEDSAWLAFQIRCVVVSVKFLLEQIHAVCDLHDKVDGRFVQRYAHTAAFILCLARSGCGVGLALFLVGRRLVIVVQPQHLTDFVIRECLFREIVAGKVFPLVKKRYYDIVVLLMLVAAPCVFGITSTPSYKFIAAWYSSFLSLGSEIPAK